MTSSRVLWLLRSASGLVLSQAVGVAAHAQANPAQDHPAAATGTASEAIATAPREWRAPAMDGAVLADEGYAAIRAGDPQRAADRLGAALAHGGLDPQAERVAVLTLSDTLMTLNEPEHAAAVLTLIKAPPATDYQVASRLAFAMEKAGKPKEAASAFATAAAAAPGPAEQSQMLKGRAFSLTALDRGPEALETAARLADAPGLGRDDAVSLAYMAVKYGDDRLALRFFDRADAMSGLDGDPAANAAYAARRLGDDARALKYFKASLKGPSQAARDAQKRYQIRREVADLSRRFGAVASVFYGTGDTFTGGIVRHADHSNVQIGGEAYFRPFGFNGGRTVEVFGRVFETAASKAGDATGARTIQGWVGVRARPFPQLNFVLEGARLLKIGSTSISDWQVRAAFSATTGMDLRQDKRAWNMRHVYADVSHLVDRDETFAVVDARAGRAFRVGKGNLMAAPFAGAYLTHDSALRRSTALGVGPGIWLRQWLRETEEAAPRSAVVLTLQYRFRLGGDKRASGFFLTFSAAL
jgi:hypothetical protein